MYKVKCPICNVVREVRAKKPWMVGDEPFIKRCKVHAEGKEKSEEHKKKLSESLKKTQTEEVLKRKSDYMKSHPELWDNLHPELGPLSRVGTHHTEESKKKISKGVSEAKQKDNENEQR